MKRVQTGDTDPPGGTRYVHHCVEHRRGLLGGGFAAVAVRFEADRIHRRVDFGDPQNLLDLVLRISLGHIDRFATEAACPGQPVFVQVADDHHGGAQQQRGGGGS